MPDEGKASTWRWRSSGLSGSLHVVHAGKVVLAIEELGIPETVNALTDLVRDANLGAVTRQLRQEIGDLPEEDASALLDKIFPAEAQDLADSREMVLGEVARLAASGRPSTGASLLAISALVKAARRLHRAVGAATAHLEGAGDGD